MPRVVQLPDFTSKTLRTFPQTDKSLLNLDDGMPSITLGDTQGSALRMLYILTLAGVLQPTEKQYNFLRNLCEKSRKYVYEDFDNFAKELANIPVNSDIFVRFIGDTLADRGKHDFLTLLIYEHLVNKRVYFEIILSNHDVEFICAMEGSAAERSKISDNHFVLGQEYLDFANSLENLRKDARRIKELAPRAHEIYDKCLIERFKMISYEKDGGRYVIFTHAPITPDIIQKLECQLTNKYKLTPLSVDTLPHIVESINNALQELLQEKKFSVFYSLHSTGKAHVYNAREYVLYNRVINAENFDFEMLKSVPMIFVHGHTGPIGAEIVRPDNEELIKSSFYNLDTSYAGAECDVPDGTLRIYLGNLDETLIEKLKKRDSDPLRSEKEVPSFTLKEFFGEESSQSRPKGEKHPEEEFSEEESSGEISVSDFLDVLPVGKGSSQNRSFSLFPCKGEKHPEEELSEEESSGEISVSDFLDEFP